MILSFYGIKIGKNFYIEGTPKLKINGKPENIIIENNVSILGNIDLRNRENGKIIIRNNVMIEDGCRFVSAREGTIEIGESSIITTLAIFNGGGDIIIGKKCVFGARCSINSNEHIFSKDTFIQDSGYIFKSVIIEDGCWITTNVSINKGVCLGKGSIIASGAVVTKSTEKNSIYGGIPAKKIGERI